MKTNKTFLLSMLMLFSFSSLLLTSCDKETETEFDLAFSNAFTVPPLGAPFNEYKTFVSEIITSGIEAELNQYNASLNDIESVKLKDLRAEITAPAGRTFDGVVFLESFIGSSGLDDTKLAYAEESDLPGKTSVTFQSQFSDVAPHIKNDAFSFLIRGFIDQPVPTATALKVDLTLTVKIKTKK